MCIKYEKSSFREKVFMSMHGSIKSCDLRKKNEAAQGDRN